MFIKFNKKEHDHVTYRDDNKDKILEKVLWEISMFIKFNKKNTIMSLIDTAIKIKF